jgi:hypothetical protein
MPTAVDPFIPVKRPTAPSLRAKPALVNNAAKYYVKRPTTQILDLTPKKVSSPPQGQAKPAIRLPATQPPPEGRFAQGRPLGGPPRQGTSLAALRLTLPEEAEQPTTSQIPGQVLPSVKKPSGRVWNKVQLVVAAGLIIGIGVLMQSLIIGELCILAYAIFAVARRVPSHTTFMLAGISLASILVLMRVNSYSPLAGNFAVYAFMLLALGVITLVRETVAQNKQRAKA